MARDDRGEVSGRDRPQPRRGPGHAAPRGGNAGFPDASAARSVRRYVDCTDKVTAVAPELLGYRHLAGERYIDRHGVVHALRPDPAAVADDHRQASATYLRTY